MISPENKRTMGFWGVALTVLFVLGGFDVLHGQSGEETTTADSVEAMRSEAYQLNQRANQLAGQQRYQEAIPVAKRALLLSRKVNGTLHRDVAADLFSLANLYMATGDYFNAEPLIQEAIGIDRKLFGEQHPEVAVDMGGLGLLYKKMKNYEAAEKSFLDATAMIQNSLAEDGNARYFGYLAKLYHNLGNIQLEMRKHDAAFTSYFNAEQIYEILDRRSAVKLLIDMAEIKRQLGDQAGAEAFLQRARQLSE